MIYDKSWISDDDGPEDAPIEKAYCRHKCPICKLIVPKGDDCIKGCHVECYNEQDEYNPADDNWIHDIDMEAR